jgi:crotonobetainyl-CoA:carnitine CoA-transferase CaiB-like acyl-CoA transferase
LLNIAANKQEQFKALAQAVGASGLVTDARFADRESRKKNRAALTAELEAALQHKSAADWETMLNGLGIPAGRVVTVPEALSNPQVLQRELLQTFPDAPGVNRPLTLTRAGFKLSGADPVVSSPPPRLGEHTDEILRAVGYTKQEIAALRRAKAI